jgi:dolichol-phosphate mannosyltransferase
MIAMTWNFYLNRRLTFSYARGSSMLRQYVFYCASCACGAAVSWSVSVGLTFSAVGFLGKPLPAAVVGVVAGSLLNYFSSRYLVFRRVK